MKSFPNFDRYACVGDTIETECGSIRLVATIRENSDYGPPDREDEGFWPSLDPKDAGYIGPKTPATLARHMKRAHAVMDAWRNDEWHYVGVTVQAFIGETPLTGEYDHACWGLEMNYPTTRKGNPNDYLRTVADDLAEDCHKAALERLEELAEESAVIRPDNVMAALKRLLGVFDSRDVPARILARQEAESVIAELEGKRV